VSVTSTCMGNAPQTSLVSTQGGQSAGGGGVGLDAHNRHACAIRGSYLGQMPRGPRTLAVMAYPQFGQVTKGLALEVELIHLAPFKGIWCRAQQLLAPAGGSIAVYEFNVHASISACTPDVAGIDHNLRAGQRDKSKCQCTSTHPSHRLQHSLFGHTRPLVHMG